MSVEEEKPVLKERRAGFRFDKSISIGTILTIVALIGASWSAVTRIADGLKDSQLKVNIMWKQFIHDHPDTGNFYDNIRER